MKNKSTEQEQQAALHKTDVSRRFTPIAEDDPKFEILFREGNWSAYDYQLTEMMKDLVLRYNDLVKFINGG